MKRKYTVDRSTWRCGGRGQDPKSRHGEGMTLLYNPDDKLMCCLGHVSLQLDCPLATLVNQGTPKMAAQAYVSAAERMRGILISDDAGRSIHNTLASVAMDINDDGSLSTDEREAKLIAHFADHDYELEFTGEYRPELLTIGVG